MQWTAYSIRPLYVDRLEEFFYFYQNDEAETDNLN